MRPFPLTLSPLLARCARHKTYKVMGMALGAVVWLTGTAALAEDPTPLSPVVACRDIADPADRLACYDQQVGALKAAQDKGEIVAYDKDKVKTVQREAFGFSLPSLPKLGLPGEDIDSVDVLVTKMRHVGGETWIFFLDNGQIWEQIDDRLSRPRRLPIEASIRTAAFGSYLMKVGDQRAVRVRRVQ